MFTDNLYTEIRFRRQTRKLERARVRIKALEEKVKELERIIGHTSLARLPYNERHAVVSMMMEAFSNLQLTPKLPSESSLGKIDKPTRSV